MKYSILLSFILAGSYLIAQGGDQSYYKSQVMQENQINIETLKKDHWNALELQNASVVVEFMQKLMNDHQFAEVSQKFASDNYVQHNRTVPDGIPGLVETMKKLTKRFPEYSYDVRQVIASHDLVVFHSQMTFKKKHRGNQKKGILVVDTWRLKDGKIVEHWDAIQPLDLSSRFLFLLTGGKIRNSNGIF